RRLMNPGFRRAGLVVLLVGGAYFAALPWINCAFGLRFWAPDLIRICTFGTGVEAFTGPGALWPYLLIAIIYLFAALGVALTKGIDERVDDERRREPGDLLGRLRLRDDCH